MQFNCTTNRRSTTMDSNKAWEERQRKMKEKAEKRIEELGLIKNQEYAFLVRRCSRPWNEYDYAAGFIVGNYKGLNLGFGGGAFPTLEINKTWTRWTPERSEKTGEFYLLLKDVVSALSEKIPDEFTDF